MHSAVLFCDRQKRKKNRSPGDPAAKKVKKTGKSRVRPATCRAHWSFGEPATGLREGERVSRKSSAAGKKPASAGVLGDAADSFRADATRRRSPLRSYPPGSSRRPRREESRRAPTRGRSAAARGVAVRESMRRGRRLSVFRERGARASSRRAPPSLFSSSSSSGWASSKREGGT